MTPTPEMLEAEKIAKLVFEAMRYATGKADTPHWVERGNSLMQEEARRIARRIAESIVAAPAPLPVAVKIKPLEWLREAPTQWVPETWKADSIADQYDIQREKDGTFSAFAPNAGTSIFGTLDEAKAAAQADYETRIRSALSSPVGGMEEPAENYSNLLQALSRLAGNRHSDGVSTLVSSDDRSAIINGCHGLLLASRTPASDIADLQERLMEAENIVKERDDRLALVDRIADLIGLPEDQELDQVAFELWMDRNRTDIAALREACNRMATDYQISQNHHPNHVLVGLADFEAMRSALSQQEESRG